MLDQLSAADFAPHVDTMFRIAFSDGQVELRLAEVQELPRATAAPSREAARTPFSLLFVHSGATFYLPQRIYTLEHAALGAIEIFVVPLGPDARGMRYQAIFT